MADQTRTMEVTLQAKDQTKKATSAAKRNLSDLGNEAKRLAKIAGGLSVAFGVAALAKSTQAWAAQEKQLIQVEKRLASTKHAAGLTSKELQGMAKSLQQQTVFTDQAILSMQSFLLTFTQIKGDVFKDANRVILDVAAAMAGQSGGEIDLKSASIQVGKALNDPKVGVSALAEVGVSFTDQQKDVIKSLVDTGEVAKAQKIILEELKVEFGGAAGAEGLAGAATQAKNALEGLFEAFGQGVDEGANLASTLQDVSKELSNPVLIDGIKTMGEWVGVAAGAWHNLAAEVGAFAGGGQSRADVDASVARLSTAGTDISPDIAFMGMPGGRQEPIADIPQMGIPQMNLGPIAPEPMELPDEIGEMPIPGIGLGKTMDDYQADLEFKAELFNESLLNEEEQIVATYENRREVIDEFLMFGVMSLEQHKAAEVAIWQKAEEKQTLITKKEAQKRKQRQAQTLGAIQTLTTSVFGALSANLDLSQKKDFEKNKQYSIANATINTALGVTKALTTMGPPVSFIMAAATLAAGIAQISAISSQSFSGGGGPASVPAAPAIPETVEQPTAPETGGEGGVSYNIQILGNVVDHDQFARELITPLERARNDGEEPEPI